MFRLSTFAFFALVACTFMFSAALASPSASKKVSKAASIIQSSTEVPQGQHDHADRITTVDVSGRQLSTQIHDEVPEASFEPNTDDTVDITERMEQDAGDKHAASLKSLTVDEFKTSPTALSSVPSAKTKLPTSDRVVYGTFIGYARYRTRCYRLRSNVIHARYTPYRGYYCRGRIYYVRNYICVRPVCLARIYYWRY